MGAIEPRPKAWQVRRLVSEHAFDKLRLIDCLFSEFSAACEAAEVIGVKEGGPVEFRWRSASRAERYLTWEVAEKLHALLDAMLTGDVEVATRHFGTTTAA